MKKLLFLIPLGLFLSACSNDFEVTAPWKEIPVVYAILSPQDTAHYIRVEKAFVDPEKSALTIAQIADSLYYPANAITVWLENTSSGARVQLNRVNGSLEGYPRNGGIFATEPNWLYKYKPTGNAFLQGGKQYRIVIERADGRPDITAETSVPASFSFTRPNAADLPPKISFTGRSETEITWNTDVNGYYFNITFVVRINVKALNGTILRTETLVWEAAKNLERGNTSVGNGLYRGTASLTGTSFYNFLAQNLQRPPSGQYREFQSCDLILEGGGKEIKQYLETAQANSGVTGAETFPNYSNISEGFGIFTAKNKSVLESIRFTTATVDSMNVSPIADTLGFKY